LIHLVEPRVTTFSTGDGLPSRDVWSVSPTPDGGLWVGTYEGPARRVGERFAAPPVWFGKEPVVVWGVDSNHAYAGLFNKVYEVSPAGANLLFSDTAHPNDSFRFISRTRDGSFIVGGGGGIWRRSDTGVWRSDPLLHKGPNYLGWAEGAGGEMFVGTDGDGLFQLTASRPWTPVKLPGAPATAWVAYWPEGGEPWVSSSFGLYRRRRDGGWDHWTTAEGLVENEVMGVLPDGAGHVWIHGELGVYRLSVESLNAVAEHREARLRILHLGEKDGLANSECNGDHMPGSAIDAEGRFWFPTAGGLARVDPREIDGFKPPLPLLTDVVDLDVGLNGLSVPHDRIMAFTSGRGRTLRFHFTAPAPTEARQVQIEYQLVGIDSGWRSAKRNREAVYANLHPGRYIFELRAALADGYWYPAPVSWAFKIRPWIWERRDAQVGLAVFVLGGVVLAAFLRLRTQARIAGMERAAALEAERRRLARDMHDGLGVDLARMNLAAASGAVDIGALSREMINKLDTLVWLTDPAEDRLDALLDRIALRLESFFAETEVRLTLDLPPSPPAAVLPGRWRRELLAWIDEGLNNVARHSHATEVLFRVFLHHTFLEVTLKDNGVGLSDTPTRHGGGRGMSHMRQRAAALGGSLHVESLPAGGVLLRLILPWPPEISDS
jgi:signal transduction histidine kinase